jgi:serralysin
MATIFVNLGNTSNTITFGNDDHIVTGENGDNTLTFGGGADSLTLGNGNNTLTLAGGDDRISAGGGNNTITVSGLSASRIVLKDGNNTVSVADGQAIIQAGHGMNTLTAGDGINRIVVGDGVNAITSGDGNSRILVGDGGGNTITVGTGANRIVLGEGTANILSAGGGGNIVAVSAAALGTDSISGGLETGDGSGNAINVTTAGIVGVTGVSGFATFRLAQDGPNSITLTNANFARLPDGVITVVGGAMGNVMEASSLAAANDVALRGGAGVDVFNGGAGNDRMSAGDGADTLLGGAGDDTINGGTGADHMEGGSGNDRYVVDHADDVVIEAAGGGTADLVMASISYTLGDQVERLNLLGTAITGTGNDQANRIMGQGSDNQLLGAGGDDILLGGAGDDKLDGGTGADRLIGGTGADAFAFTTALGAGNVDRITDYSVGEDRILLDSFIFGSMAAGALEADAFFLGATAGDAADRILYDAATGVLAFDADGSGAGKAIAFAMLSTGLAMTASDIVIIG